VVRVQNEINLDFVLVHGREKVTSAEQEESVELEPDRRCLLVVREIFHLECLMIDIFYPQVLGNAGDRLYIRFDERQPFHGIELDPSGVSESLRYHLFEMLGPEVARLLALQFDARVVEGLLERCRMSVARVGAMIRAKKAALDIHAMILCECGDEGVQKLGMKVVSRGVGEDEPRIASALFRRRQPFVIHESEQNRSRERVIVLFRFVLAGYVDELVMNVMRAVSFEVDGADTDLLRHALLDLNSTEVDDDGDLVLGQLVANCSKMVTLCDDCPLSSWSSLRREDLLSSRFSMNAWLVLGPALS
jgi:hypothetical protein